MTSLSMQLEGFRKQKHRKNVVSILFSKKEASSMDDETIYHMALNGLLELEKDNGEFSQYHKNLFAQSAIRYNRASLTSEELAVIDSQIQDYLMTLSPVFLTKAAQKTLEFLIRRYEIHVFNVRSILSSALCYHESQTFKTIASILDFERDLRSFSFLKSSTSIITRSLLAKRCVNDLSLVQFIIDMALNNSCHEKISTFVTVTFLAMISEAKVIQESFSRLVLSLVFKALKKSPSSSLYTGALMITASLANRVTLSQPVFLKIVKALLQTKSYKCLASVLISQKNTDDSIIKTELVLRMDIAEFLKCTCTYEEIKPLIVSLLSFCVTSKVCDKFITIVCTDSMFYMKSALSLLNNTAVSSDRTVELLELLKPSAVFENAIDTCTNSSYLYECLNEDNTFKSIASLCRALESPCNSEEAVKYVVAQLEGGAYKSENAIVNIGSSLLHVLQEQNVMSILLKSNSVKEFLIKNNRRELLLVLTSSVIPSALQDNTSSIALEWLQSITVTEDEKPLVLSCLLPQVVDNSCHNILDILASSCHSVFKLHNDDANSSVASLLARNVKTPADVEFVSTWKDIHPLLCLQVLDQSKLSSSSGSSIIEEVATFLLSKESCCIKAAEIIVKNTTNPVKALRTLFQVESDNVFEMLSVEFVPAILKNCDSPISTLVDVIIISSNNNKATTVRSIKLITAVLPHVKNNDSMLFITLLNCLQGDNNAKATIKCMTAFNKTLNGDDNTTAAAMSNVLSYFIEIQKDVILDPSTVPSHLCLVLNKVPLASKTYYHQLLSVMKNNSNSVLLLERMISNVSNLKSFWSNVTTVVETSSTSVFKMILTGVLRYSTNTSVKKSYVKSGIENPQQFLQPILSCISNADLKLCINDIMNVMSSTSASASTMSVFKKRVCKIEIPFTNMTSSSSFVIDVLCYTRTSNPMETVLALLQELKNVNDDEYEFQTMLSAIAFQASSSVLTIIENKESDDMIINSGLDVILQSVTCNDEDNTNDVLFHSPQTTRTAIELLSVLAQKFPHNVLRKLTVGSESSSLLSSLVTKSNNNAADDARNKRLLIQSVIPKLSEYPEILQPLTFVKSLVTTSTFSEEVVMLILKALGGDTSVYLSAIIKDVRSSPAHSILTKFNASLQLKSLVLLLQQNEDLSCISFVSSHLANKKLHGAILDYEDHSVLETLYLELAQELLSSLSDDKKQSEVSLNALSHLEQLLSVPSFVAVISELLGNTHFQKRALLMLNQRVTDETSNSSSNTEVLSPGEELLFVEMLTDLRRTIDSENTSSSPVVIQTACLSIDVLAKAFLKPESPHVEKFKTVMNSLVVLGNTHENAHVVASAFVSLTTCIECLSLSSVVVGLLPKFLPALVSTTKKALLEGESSSEAVTRQCCLLTSVLKCVSLPHVAAFMTPYFSQIFDCLVHPVMKTSSNPCSAYATPIQTALVSNVQVRQLLPSVFKYCRESSGGDVCHDVFYSMLSTVLTGMKADVLSMQLASVFQFFLSEFDLISSPLLLKCWMSFVLKLNEKQLKPIFLKLCEWSSTFSEKRKVVLYEIMGEMCKTLKSIFVPYYAYVWKDFVTTLSTSRTTSTSTVSSDAAVTSEEEEDDDDSMFVRPSKKLKTSNSEENSKKWVLVALNECFKYDKNSFMDKENFEQILSPVIEQLQYKEEEELVIETVANLAWAIRGEDVLWKPLHHQIFMTSRSECSGIRLRALKCIQKCYEVVGEEFLIMLPESIPFLSELMDDDEMQVQKLCQSVVKQIENLSGESLDDYLTS